MSVRSFHSVFMASVVAGAALGCYLVSLRVASERAALEQVETEIVLAQRDIRLLQTEIGTRARLAQLERWNVRVLALSAPTADQILGDKFQLARMISPERKPAMEAPVILASAPAVAPTQLQPEGQPVMAAPAGQLLHEASLTLPEPKALDRKPARPEAIEAASPKSRTSKTDIEVASAAAAKLSESKKKAGEKTVKASAPALTKPVRTAKVDPLAPLPAEPTGKGSRTDR